MKRFSTKMLCRAGIIAALYCVLTWALGPLSYGTLGFQIRLAEALTLLALFYIESIPALYVGCLLANVFSGYGGWDIGLGSLCTLVAAIGTYGVGRLVRNMPLKLILGGLFPVLVNAFGVPCVMILAGSTELGYWANFVSLLVTQSVWVYGLGIPLMLTVNALVKKGVSVLQPAPLWQKHPAEDGKTAAPQPQTEQK